MKLFFIGMILAVFAGCSYHPPKQPVKSDAINWYFDESLTVKASKSTKKPIFIYFHATWCSFCLKMTDYTLRDSRVISVVNNEFIPLSVDIDQSSLSKRVGLKLVPTIVIVDINKSNPVIIEGFIGPNELLRRVHLNQ